MSPRLVRFAIATIVVVAPPASAQETTHVGSAPDLPAHPDPYFVDPGMHKTWNDGRPRAFAATTIDAGYLYLRPRGHVGYGLPFNAWIGLEANPLLGAGGYGGYGGMRLALPYFDLRVGARQFSAFRHAFLDPKASYDRLDLDITVRDPARYYTLEAEANGAIPIGLGDLLITGSISAVGNVSDGAYVFEETLRVIVDPPWVWRGRVGYVFRFGARYQHSIGPMFDVLHVPERDGARTYRFGPVLRIQLSRHFDVRGSFVATIVSPDRLGLVGGDFTELGVRYRTATE